LKGASLRLTALIAYRIAPVRPPIPGIDSAASTCAGRWKTHATSWRKPFQRACAADGAILLLHHHGSAGFCGRVTVVEMATAWCPA
jgi:hypothetical protein